MQLEKYYVDVVTPSGEGCVGYAARLAGAPVIIGALLHWPPSANGETQQRRTLHGTRPVQTDDVLAWRCSTLAVDGLWRSKLSGFGQCLWSEADHAVRWQVLAPTAEVTLRLGDREMRGLGYAERLLLDIAPWRLPITALRWGRFVSATQSVVWIAWDHATPRRWLWHNGRQVTPTEITERAVKWDAHSLSIEEGCTIRRGRLAATALSGWAPVRRLLPAAIRNFHETKWCARGSLSNGHGAPDSGWVLHECVRFR